MKWKTLFPLLIMFWTVDREKWNKTLNETKPIDNIIKKQLKFQGNFHTSNEVPPSLRSFQLCLTKGKNVWGIPFKQRFPDKKIKQKKPWTLVKSQIFRIKYPTNDFQSTVYINTRNWQLSLTARFIDVRFEKAVISWFFSDFLPHKNCLSWGVAWFTEWPFYWEAYFVLEKDNVTMRPTPFIYNVVTSKVS